MSRMSKKIFPNSIDELRNTLPIPIEGLVYAFRTAPFSEFAPPFTGRYAALKIIGVSDADVIVAVLDGIWATAPILDEARTTSILCENRFSFDGTPAVFAVHREWWQPEACLEQFSFVGVWATSATEQTLANAIMNFEIGSSFAGIDSASITAEGEWRWSNDREALVRENHLEEAKAEAKRAREAERYLNRLKGLTWSQLLSENPFGNWSPSPPFPSGEFTDAARLVIHDGCIALQALGPKPRKGDVRAVLKKTVQWFNEADEAAGGVIETEEREDICAVLEEMAVVARQKSLMDEIDAWRSW